MHAFRFFAALAIGAGAPLLLVAAPVKLEFTALDASADPVRVVLVDPATGDRAWVPVGGRFAGCEVRAYDARTRTLALARGAETWEIALEGARIASSALAPGEVERVTKQVRNNLRQLAAAADQYFLEYGVSTVRLDRLVGSEPTHYIRKLEPADGEDYSKLNLDLPSPTTPSREWTIVTARGIVVRHTR